MDQETINRNLIIILPKQPALDWIISVDPQPMQGLTLEQLRQGNPPEKGTVLKVEFSNSSI